MKRTIQNTESLDVKKCKQCSELGEYIIKRRKEQNGIYIKDLYWLCNECYTKLFILRCEYCDSKDVYKDYDILKIVCKKCGSVLGDLPPLINPTEKKDYDGNDPNDYEYAQKEYDWDWSYAECRGEH
jgi:hypothetical protein